MVHAADWQRPARSARSTIPRAARSIPPVVSTIVEIFCAALARVNVSVLYQLVDTANRPWPTSRPLQPIRKDLVIRFRRQRLAREAIMAAKEISVKKYVVRLSGE